MQRQILEIIQRDFKKAKFDAHHHQFQQALRWNNLEVLTKVLKKYPSLITDDMQPVCYACKWGSDSLIEKLIDVNVEYSNWLYKQLEPILNVESDTFRKLIENYILYEQSHHRVLARAFDTAIEYARPQCLQKILQVAKLHKVNLRFDPTFNVDRIKLKWILDNIERGKDGKRVGWDVGPDSGAWPSKLLTDYISVYEILTKKFPNVSSYLNGECKGWQRENSI